MSVEQGCSNEIESVTEGAAVLREVGRMTGLPESYLDSALSGMLGSTEGSVNQMSLEHLRSLLLDCLESLNQEIVESGSPESMI